MKKVAAFFGLVLVVGLFLAAVGLIFNRGTWECVNGKWVKKGSPLGAPPSGGCGSLIRLGDEFPTPVDDLSPQVPSSSTEQLVVLVGQEFTISVNNPSGSLTWLADFDANYLELIGESGDLTENRFEFKARERGDTTLNLYTTANGNESSVQNRKIYRVIIE